MRRFLASGLLAAAASPVMAAMFSFSDPSGLSAEVEFTLLNPTTLEIRARNTSTGAPLGFSNSDALLTSISWDFDDPGINDPDPDIAGGNVIIGPSSSSVNFDTGFYPAGSNVNGEYGFGNMDGTGLLPNFVSANNAQTTPFGGPNLDGPASIDGPQGGMHSSSSPIGLGGLGAIQDEIIATVTINQALPDLGFLDSGVRIEFGSDAFFIQIPEPSSLILLGLGGLIAARRR